MMDFQTKMNERLWEEVDQLKEENERLTAVNGTLLAACEEALKHIQGQWLEVGNHPAHHLADCVSELAEVIAKAKGE